MDFSSLNLIAKISEELKLQEFQVNNTIKLMFAEECTIPFVARYRKEMTGSLDEVTLRAVRDRYNYLSELETTKVKYWKVIEVQSKEKPELAAKLPELKKRFELCQTKQELEDLYLPFKPKRRTRAQVAREKGLEALLDKILAERGSLQDLDPIAADFVTPADSKIDASLKVENVAAALAGAGDIFSERISEHADARAKVRQISYDTGLLVSKKNDDTGLGEPLPAEVTAGKKIVEFESAKDKKDSSHKYQNYFDYKEPVSTAAAHRIMAVRRGEAEKVLRVTIDVDVNKIIESLKALFIGTEPITNRVRVWIEGIIESAYKRLLGPSIETEVRLLLKTRAEEEAIRVFSRNLQNLLMLPPIPGKVVLGVDPGLRTGSKLAAVSETGKLLEYSTIYPDLGKTEEGEKTRRAKEELYRLLTKHNVQVIAIGNGTGSREIDKLITSVIRDKGLTNIKRLVVNEAGASVYSTDDLAREEFPDLDATIRSAISIARRLQDPLAELVKINPRSIGVGQYQHDVNVTKLQTSLEEVVESCVNRVGVNLNTASYRLLGYVSGIGPALAKNIVSFRDSNGKFGGRTQLLNVTGFGPKAFEQAAGFLRIPDGENPLDNSAVHPERYEIVSRIATDIGKELKEIVGRREIVESVSWERYVSDLIGMPTLQDISEELIKPGRDPREDGARLLFSDEVSTLEDLKPNMVLMGTVTNVTNFGAFVDIGVHQDGLVHISELSEKFVKDPATVISVGDVIKVRILDVDVARSRISLSCKLVKTEEKAPVQRNDRPPPGDNRPRRDDSRRDQGRDHDRRQSSGPPPRREDRGPPPKPKKQQPQYTMNDLISKFNRK